MGFGNAATGASATYDRHLYMTNAGQLVFGVYAGANRVITSPSSYRDGQWHQAVATLSSAGMRLYLDGSLVASDASVTTARAVSGSYLRVGYDNITGWPSVPTSRFFAGTLDEAALFLTALTPAQVSDQYEAADLSRVGVSGQLFWASKVRPRVAVPPWVVSGASLRTA